MTIFEIFRSIELKLFVHQLKKEIIYFGKGSQIKLPLRISGHKNIYIGNNVIIGCKIWLTVRNENNPDAILTISDGCRIGNFNHIYATHSIIIENDVLTADKVYISDNSHNYDKVDIPIYKQAIIQKNDVTIGEGSWIGENVCIIGAKIGKHCVIGANSVVLNDIPDCCVAAGSPAKIVKKYDKKTNSWIKYK